MTNPADMVDRIVAGVLEQLQAPTTGVGVAAASATATVAAPGFVQPSLRLRRQTVLSRFQRS